MNSKEWWNRVKKDPALFNEWLIKQYRGEVTAAERIRALYTNYETTERQKRLLEVIASQEEQHAEWVLGLLNSRGITPSMDNAEKRYWSKVLPGIKDFFTGSAVAAHAEKMRLERIQVIVEDTETPIDVRAVFTRILRDELFHERAFRQEAGDKAMDATKDNQELGEEALGLTA